MRVPVEVSLIFVCFLGSAGQLVRVEAVSDSLSLGELSILGGACLSADPPDPCPDCPETPGCGACHPQTHACGNPGALSSCAQAGNIVHKISNAIIGGKTQRQQAQVICHTLTVCGGTCNVKETDGVIAWTCPEDGDSGTKLAEWPAGNYCYIGE